ncbi:MAG: methionine--tRNA ligase [Actinomycetota bacterium]
MTSEGVFYLTTPIYYVDDVPHLGHAYTTIAADFLARFRRMQGREVYFLTGTDEHGQKVARSAEAQGVAPKAWADQIVPRWKEVWAALDISYDDFIRTTDQRHESAVQTFVQQLYDRDEIYLGTYRGLYCVGCEEFKLPDDLVDGKCPLHGTEPEQIEEDNYFFRLSRYRERLIELYETNPRFVMPETRRREILGKVRTGLDDLSMSRVSFDWGIPIPWDEKHVIYVWVDALQNYITAVGFGNDRSTFERIWPADVHLVGKDILWFHSVIWPAMLMALDLPLPETVFAHGWLQVGGEKMSKSKLTGISPHDLVATFGSDGYRYFFAREVSFGLDGNFSWEAMMSRYNADLANDFGNLVSRVTSMMTRYLDGRIPERPIPDELTESEHRLIDVQRRSFELMERYMGEIAPHEAVKACWAFVKKANSYVEEVTPWSLSKDPADSRRLEVVLYMLADSLRLLALMTAPILPRAAQELWTRLGIDGEVATRTFPEDLRWNLLPSGGKVATGVPLFPRLEEGE